MSRPTPGFYDATMDAAQMNATPDGKEFVEAFVRLTDTGQRVKVRAMFVHTSGCMEVTIKQLRIAGWNGEYEPMGFDGRTFRAKVTEQVDRDGQVQYDDHGEAWVWVDGFWEKGGGGLREAKIDPGKKAQMGERMRAMLQSLNAETAVQGTPVVSAQQPAPAWTPPPGSTPFTNPTPPQAAVAPVKLGFCADCGSAYVAHPTATSGKVCSNRDCSNSIPF